jgi:hypothetical protein
MNSMRKISLFVIAAALASVAACDDVAYRDAEPDVVEPTINVPPIAEDAGVPAADTVPDTTTAPPPVDRSALPPDERSSAETVAPESETLFY